MDAPSLEWAPLTSTMAVDGEGARDDDAVSFSSDVDEPGVDADIDADDIAALLDEREAAAPDEPLALATVAKRNLPDDFLHLAGPEDIARAVAKLAARGASKHAAALPDVAHLVCKLSHSAHQSAHL